MSAATIDQVTEQSVASRCRVQMWLGDYLIADTIAEPAYAARHEAAMRALFGDLRITNHPVGSDQ